MSKGQRAEGRGQKKAGKTGKSAKAPRNAKDVRLSEHPRAKHQIALAKSWGGLIGFALAGYVSYTGGLPFFDVAIRALGWGLAAYVLVWFCSVQVWRHLAVAEVKSAEKLWRQRRDEQRRAMAEENTTVIAGGRQG